MRSMLMGLLMVASLISCQSDDLETQEIQLVAQTDLAKSSTFLRIHESCGGHTIERHVAKSDDYLRYRLATSSISAASTFNELNQAGQVIVNAINANSSSVNNWLNGSGGSRLVLDYTHWRDIGRVLRRGASYTYSTGRFRVVLERSYCSSYPFKVLTAYPN